MHPTEKLFSKNKIFFSNSNIKLRTQSRTLPNIFNRKHFSCNFCNCGVKFGKISKLINFWPNWDKQRPPWLETWSPIANAFVWFPASECDIPTKYPLKYKKKSAQCQITLPPLLSYTVRENTVNPSKHAPPPLKIFKGHLRFAP